MEKLKHIFAQRLIKLRTEHNMTQLELAEQLNYSDKAISKWERGESIPDASVIVHIAKLFNVTVDSLVCQEKTAGIKEKTYRVPDTNKRNHFFITGMAVFAVWFAAVLAFIVLEFTQVIHSWLSFVYAVPVSMIVWLVFNSIWFNHRMNYIIISVLMWTALGSACITAAVFGLNINLLLLLGAPGQIIILFWSFLRYRKKNKKKTDNVEL